MHAIYQHFSELIEQAVIQLCPNLFLNFPAAAELQVLKTVTLLLFSFGVPQVIQTLLSSLNSKNLHTILFLGRSVDYGRNDKRILFVFS